MEYVSTQEGLERERVSISFGSVVVMVAGSFLIGRACFFNQDFPAGIALIAVLISFSTLNIYLLPAVLIGIGSFYHTGYLLWGDIGAACGCALVFMLAKRVELSLWHKAAIAGAITIIARNVYHIGAHLQYRNTVADMLTEGVTVALLCIAFHVCGQLIMEKENRNPFEIGLISVTVIFMLMAVGTGFIEVAVVAGLLFILFIGYTTGVMEGVTAGFAAGIIALCCGSSLMVVLIFTAGGLVAGLFKGYNRFFCCLCFGGVTVGISLLNLGAPLGMLPWYFLLAPTVLLLLPQKWILRLDLAFSSLLKSDAHLEKKKRSKVIQNMQEVKHNFEELSTIFASSHNDRIILSYHFRGMAQAIDKVIRNIRRGPGAEECRYGVESAWAGYARSLGVSGDSYGWEDLEDGRFVVLLSDGMGKGERAAAESSLVVNTVVKLLKAGIEVEVVLKILNSILLIQSKDEIFSTVDLGIINKRTGKMKLYKVGAATTFIKRKNTVETVKIPAMPMGIVDGLKVDYVTVALKPGDQVIMISDGVTDSRRDDLAMSWLRETVSGIRSKDPQTMCDLIMNKAVENYGIKEKDDLTVLAVRVS